MINSNILGVNIILSRINKNLLLKHNLQFLIPIETMCPLLSEHLNYFRDRPVLKKNLTRFARPCFTKRSQETPSGPSSTVALYYFVNLFTFFMLHRIIMV